MKLVLLGRTNVGKSTLFNRLAGSSDALVADEPHWTRDCREGVWQTHTVLDTPGWQMRPDDALARGLMEQTRRALEGAELVLFVCDARAGTLAEDEDCARALHQSGVPVVVIANKCDGKTRLRLGELERLGFGAPLEISALHGAGLEHLEARLPRTPSVPHTPSVPETPILAPAAHLPETPILAPAATEKPSSIKFAIIGRPNVGKSTLVNTLSGAGRLTGAAPGLTREAGAWEWRWKGRDILLHDTPGLRRQARAQSRAEKMSRAQALKAVQFAEVVVVLMAADEAFDKQDVQLAEMVYKEGRALVLAVNKIDTIAGKRAWLKNLAADKAKLLEALGAPALVPISATQRTGLQAMMREAMRTHSGWNRTLATGELNRWLQRATTRHAPPMQRLGSRRAAPTKLRYAVQTRTRPPRFTIFGNRTRLAESYMRYLRNDMQEKFNLNGVPLRFSVRKGDNPFSR